MSSDDREGLTGAVRDADENGRGSDFLFLTADGVASHEEAVRDAWVLVAQICQHRDVPVRMREEVQATNRTYGDASAVVFAYSTLFLGSAVIAPLMQKLIALGHGEQELIDLVTEQMHVMMPSTASPD